MDRDLLRAALRSLLPELTTFVCWLARTRAEADDLVHDVVLKALGAAESIDRSDRLKPWLFRAARNAYIDALRAGAVRDRLIVLEGGLDELEDVEVPAVATNAFERVDVERTLALLPEPSRTALLLADLWQLPYDEIAAILDVAPNTVKSRVARARARAAVLLLAGRHDVREGSG